MRDNDLENSKIRANAVQQIISNTEFKTAFVSIQANYISKLTKTAFGDEKEREYLHKMLLLVSELEDHFNKVLQNGKIAEKTLMQKIKNKTLKGL
jgi:superoxide dismutase